MNFEYEFDKLGALYKQKWCKYVYPQTWSDVVKHVNYSETCSSFLQDEHKLSWHDYCKQTVQWLTYVRQLKSKSFQTYALNKLIKQDLYGLHILLNDDSIRELGATATKLSHYEHGLFSLKYVLRSEPNDVLIGEDWLNILSISGRFPQTEREFSEAAVKWINYESPIYSEEHPELPVNIFKRYNDNKWAVAMTRYLYNTRHILHHNAKLCPFKHFEEDPKDFIKYPNYEDMCILLNELSIKHSFSEMEYNMAGKNLLAICDVIKIDPAVLTPHICDKHHRKCAYARFKLLQCSRTEHSKQQMMCDYCRAYTDTLYCTPFVCSRISADIFSQLKTRPGDIPLNEIDSLKQI